MNRHALEAEKRFLGYKILSGEITQDELNRIEQIRQILEIDDVPVSKEIRTSMEELGDSPQAG